MVCTTDASQNGLHDRCVSTWFARPMRLKMVCTTDASQNRLRDRCVLKWLARLMCHKMVCATDVSQNGLRDRCVLKWFARPMCLKMVGCSSLVHEPHSRTPNLNFWYVNSSNFQCLTLLLHSCLSILLVQWPGGMRGAFE